MTDQQPVWIVTKLGKNEGWVKLEQTIYTHVYDEKLPRLGSALIYSKERPQ